MEGMLGEITPGAVADFIVVDGNPLEDISLLFVESKAIMQVFKEGQPYGPGARFIQYVYCINILYYFLGGDNPA